jgi:hypothetical protein
MADIDFKSAQRIRIWDWAVDSPNGMDVKVEWLHNEFKTASDDKIGALALAGRFATGVNLVAYDEKDAVPLLTDANGRLVVTFAGGTEPIYVDSTGFTVEEDEVEAQGFLADETATSSVTENDIGIPRMTLNRRIITAGDYLDDAAFALDTAGSYVTAIGGFYDADGSDSLDDGNIGIPRVSIKRKLMVQVSANDDANSETNPMYVHEVAAASGLEVQELKTAANVARDGTDSTSIKYVITPASTDTFLLKSLILSSSGVFKAIVQVGPAATPVNKAIVYTTGSKLTEQIFFDPPIEIKEAGGTEEVLVVVRNDDNAAMDIHCTIIGSLLNT